MGSAVTKSRMLAGSVLVATFVAGAMVGGATLRLLATDQVPEDARSGEPRRDGERSRRGSMFDALELTPEQRVRIDSIVEQRRFQTAEFWKEHGPQMRAIVDSTRAEIDRVLTPAQRAQAEQWRAERRRQHEEREAKERDAKSKSGDGKDRDRDPTSLRDHHPWHPAPGRDVPAAQRSPDDVPTRSTA